MRLTVFGATGGIGQEIVRQALEAGDQVTAVVRDPARLPIRHAGLDVVTAGLEDPEALRPAVAGRDAALSGLGPRGLRQVGIASSGTRSILRALREEGVGRFVAVSAAPLAPEAERQKWLQRRVVRPIVSTVLATAYADLRFMEEEVRAGAAAWTLVRPPRLLDRPVTGVYRTADDVDLRGGMVIGRADVAHLMLRCLRDPATVGRAVTIAY